MKLILASKSPRRQALLKLLEIPFKVVPSNHIEHIPAEESPGQYCRGLAIRKAQVVSESYPDDLVVGADTIVLLGQTILNKPSDLSEATAILNMLSARDHIVKTGVALVGKALNHRSAFIESTRVTFNRLTEEQIRYYVNTYSPLDKAGAYGIQDWSSVFVRGIKGDYNNVMGFPLARFFQHLLKHNLLERLLSTNSLFR